MSDNGMAGMVSVVDSGEETGSRDVSTPYYVQIMADLRRRIAAGEWGPGEMLPSTRELQEYYQRHLNNDTLALGTVRQAVSLLIALGELRGQQGKGVFVAEQASR